MPQTTKPRYLRTAQVAELLQVSPKTVSRWAQEGMLPYVRTLGGHRRYPTGRSGPCWKPCPSQPRPASRTSRLTTPPSLLSMASVAFLDHPPLDGEQETAPGPLGCSAEGTWNASALVSTGQVATTVGDLHLRMGPGAVPAAMTGSHAEKAHPGTGVWVGAG